MAEFDLVVIGSGPGGYVAAIRGAQAGKAVALIEKDQLGGICLNWGCIPTKALLRSAEVYQEVLHAQDFGITVQSPDADLCAIVARSREVAKANSAGIAFLMKKNKVTVIEGRAKLLSNESGTVSLEIVSSDGSRRETSALNVILATGARPRPLHIAPADGKQILNYRHAMSLDIQPSSLLVVGSGAIGLELAWFFNALGTKVTLIEAAPQIMPSEDAEISRFLTLSLSKQGIQCLAGATLHSLSSTETSVSAQVTDSKGVQQLLTADKALIAVGMVPNTEELGLVEVGIVQDDRGFIPVNDQMRTPAENIYAIGDCCGKQMLAHKASAEAEIAIEAILGHNNSVDYTQIPVCLYCKPQVASIGLNEARAKEQGVAYTIGRYPFQASGKARATGHTEGFIKLLFAQDSHKIIGAQILGSDATEMIATMGIALKQGMTSEQIGEVIYAHPTLSEAFADASLSSLKRAVHL